MSDDGAPTIMVVDDFPDNLEMYAAYLRFEGLRVLEMANGLEAVSKAASELPAVIVMDLSLPGLDGWEATRRLKADPRTKHIPIIALTGHALAGSAERAAEAGCDAFLTKPCLPETLHAEIVHFLNPGRGKGPGRPKSKTRR
jgi:two-component system cell cycle response regulator DivK